jgi:hypothetical protein
VLPDEAIFAKTACMLWEKMSYHNHGHSLLKLTEDQINLAVRDIASSITFDVEDWFTSMDTLTGRHNSREDKLIDSHCLEGVQFVLKTPLPFITVQQGLGLCPSERVNSTMTRTSPGSITRHL